MSKTISLSLVVLLLPFTLAIRLSTDGAFSNIVCDGSCNPFYCGRDEQPPCTDPIAPIQGRWGNVVFGGLQSGLGFIPIESNDTVLFDQEFFFARLVHFNYPITNPADSIDLNLRVRLTTDSGEFVGEQTFSYTFHVEETPNRLPCTYEGETGTPCPDAITFENGGFSNTSFEFNGIHYTLQLVGFRTSASSASPLTSQFISDENGSRAAYLFARITFACPTSCVGGGQLIRGDQGCACECLDATPCNEFQTRLPDCSCICPTTCENGGTLNTEDCSCSCTNTCELPMVVAGDCSCACPLDLCQNGGTLIEGDGCSCQCPTAVELGCEEHEFVSGICECVTTAVCGNGLVEPGEECDDSTPCCEECSFSTLPCDDGNLCTENDMCNAGECIGIIKECEDTNTTDCIVTTCNTLNGLCELINAPNGAGCDDGEDCTEDDVCTDGICIGQNVCTIEDQGCIIIICNNGDCVTQLKEDGSVCTDGNACTINDVCIEGACQGTPMTCDHLAPGPCQDATCNNGVCSLTSKPDQTTCDDNNLCTEITTCQGGFCVGDITVTCPDSIPCVQYECIPSTGICGEILLTTSCDDGDECTTNDACVNGTCVGEEIPCIAVVPPTGSSSDIAVILGATAAAAGVALIAGAALLAKKLRSRPKSGEQPGTWNPSAASNVGQNPSYEAAARENTNPLYEQSI